MHPIILIPNMTTCCMVGRACPAQAATWVSTNWPASSQYEKIFRTGLTWERRGNANPWWAVPPCPGRSRKSRSAFSLGSMKLPKAWWVEVNLITCAVPKCNDVIAPPASPPKRNTITSRGGVTSDLPYVKYVPILSCCMPAHTHHAHTLVQTMLEY
jgi:hypothetical protein